MASRAGRLRLFKSNPANSPNSRTSLRHVRAEPSRERPGGAGVLSMPISQGQAALLAVWLRLGLRHTPSPLSLPETLTASMNASLSSRQTRLILIGAAVLLSLGMGMRRSLGLFLSPVTRDLAVTAAD